MKLKPYPEYRDSGVEWIGEIPEDWDVEKLKYCTTINRESLPENFDPDYEFFYLDISNVSNNGEIKNTEFMRFEDAPSRARRIPNNHDTIISTVRTYLKAIAYLNGIPDNFIVSTGFSVLHAEKNLNPRYLFYMVSSDLFIQTVVAYSKGIAYPAINSSDLANLPVFYPNIEMQEKISSFLDKKISEIDLTIEKDKRLIELLKEKRTALINHVVTKGLDPTAEMKDSGVEWIGEIPEDWEVKKIKDVASVRISNVDKKSKPDETDVLLCNYTDVYNNNFITDNLDFMKATANLEQIKKLSLIKNDVIITKDSESPDDIAVPAIVSENLDNVVCGYHLALIRPNKEYLDGYFLFRSLESKKINDQFVVNANGVTRFGISTYPIKNSYLIIPTLKEQIKIVNYLENQISNIDKTILKINDNIRLLEEYKKSLIHHVVTGKVQVTKED